MQVFYAPDITGNIYTLNETESRHSVRVLRMKKGMQVRLIDGKGSLYEGRIEDPDPKACLIRIDSVIQDSEVRNYRLHIALSPLKNPERFEWFVEKSVEIGVDEISPVLCRNTERHNVKYERLRNIIVSAMKQSLKTRDTLLNPVRNFDDFIEAGYPGIRMIACCGVKTERKSVSDVYEKGKEAVILVGPEGDFSDDEIDKALINGFIPIHLGRSRLRTETAGVAACHSIYFINQ